jgi:hypothetical protein
MHKENKSTKQSNQPHKHGKDGSLASTVAPHRSSSSTVAVAPDLQWHNSAVNIGSAHGKLPCIFIAASRCQLMAVSACVSLCQLHSAGSRCRMLGMWWLASLLPIEGDDALRRHARTHACTHARLPPTVVPRESEFNGSQFSACCGGMLALPPL